MTPTKAGERARLTEESAGLPSRCGSCGKPILICVCRPCDCDSHMDPAKGQHYGDCPAAIREGEAE